MLPRRARLALHVSSDMLHAQACSDSHKEHTAWTCATMSFLLAAKSYDYSIRMWLLSRRNIHRGGGRQGACLAVLDLGGRQEARHGVDGGVAVVEAAAQATSMHQADEQELMSCYLRHKQPEGTVAACQRSQQQATVLHPPQYQQLLARLAARYVAQGRWPDLNFGEGLSVRARLDS